MVKLLFHYVNTGLTKPGFQWNHPASPQGALSAVDRKFAPCSGQTKYYKIGICCFSANHAALRRKSKDWLALNQDNVSECGDMSICSLLFQCASILNIQLGVLVQYKAALIIISLKINLFSPWYSWKIAELVLNNNYSLPLRHVNERLSCTCSLKIILFHVNSHI
jgi:hypothetical protein